MLDEGGHVHIRHITPSPLVDMECYSSRIVKNKYNEWCYTRGSIGYLDWCPVEYINMLEM